MGAFGFVGDPPYYCFDRFNIVEAWPTLVSERTDGGMEG